MQVTNRIRDKIKPQAIQVTPASASLRQVTHLYQISVTNTHANTLFLRLSSSITRTMTPTP